MFSRIAVSCAALAAASAAFAQSERFLILGQDGPDPAIYAWDLDKAGPWVLLYDKQDGLTGVWGLTAGDGIIFWTHMPEPGNPVLFQSDVTSIKQAPLRLAGTNDPVEINSLAFYSETTLRGTGPGDGWTVLPVDTNARTYYVSWSLGSNEPPNTGLTPQDPYKTIGHAFNQLDSGSADRILLRRGDTWNTGPINWWKSGDLDRRAQLPARGLRHAPAPAAGPPHPL